MLARCAGLDLDPPVVVAREVHEAVRRWRWRTIEGAHPSLSSAGAGRGAVMEPIWKLLNSRESTPAWNEHLRGALRSVIANRQWPQVRCFKAGFANHAKCLCCVHGVSVDSAGEAMPAAGPRPDPSQGDLAAPSQEQIDEAPVGTLFHRIWRCPRLASLRLRYAPCRMTNRAGSQEWDGDVAFERALFPSLDATVPPPAAEHSFVWVVYPEGGVVTGKVCTDGSRLDGPSRLLARNGWSFVALDTEGQVTAAAHGITPRWVDDIPGAEAWALMQAAGRAEPGTQYRVDCQPCVDAFHKGLTWATRDNRPLARVHRLMFAALADTEAAAVVWMPAHTKEEDVGRLHLGDGTLLSESDRKGNEEADRLAKLAVEAHRVPKQVRECIKELNVVVERTARWVARATFAAGHQTVRPFRDTDASRAAASAAAKRKRPSGGGKRSRCAKVKAVAVRLVTGDTVRLARRANASWKHAPTWPRRAAANRRRCSVRKKQKPPKVVYAEFLPRNLQPQVGAIPTAVRRAALLQRVRAKEAALRGTALSVAVCEAESTVEATSSHCLSVHGERPHNEWRSGAGVGLLGTAGKRREYASC